MGARDDPRRVHFQAPEDLVERLDAVAELFDTDRTDLLVEAIRAYLEETADSEIFQDLVATKYYDDQLEFETVKQLVGAETAQRLRLLKADLDDEPLDLTTPDDADIYSSIPVDEKASRLYERYQAAESDEERREIALKMGKLDGRRHADIYSTLENR